MHQFAYFINWLTLTLLWMVSIRIKDSSIIDIYWGFGFVLIAWAYSLTIMMSMDWFRLIYNELLLVMVTIWGLETHLLSCKKEFGTWRGL